jgi:glycosyltransferase involved in cell wall biosynthesis
VLIADNVIPALIAGAFLKKAGTRTIGIIRSDDSFYHGIIDTFAAGRDEDRIHAFVAVSEYLGEEVRRRSRGKCLCQVIPSGAPIPTQQAKWNPEIFQIVYSGRLVEEQKRIIETTRCMIRLCKENANIRGVIIGDGNQRDTVEDLIMRAEVPISVVGRKSPEEVQEILLNSHAILLLSEYEGTPTAVMEAMACGVVPVCLAMRSGIPELVTHEKTGLIVMDRAESCVHVVGSLSKHADAWMQLSISARNHAIRSFSTTFVALRWNSFLSDLSDGRTTGICRIPNKFFLPPAHPAYSHQDPRDPGAMKRLAEMTRFFFSRSRFHASRIGRKILGRR